MKLLCKVKKFGHFVIFLRPSHIFSCCILDILDKTIGMLIICHQLQNRNNPTNQNVENKFDVTGNKVCNRKCSFQGFLLNFEKNFGEFVWRIFEQYIVWFFDDFFAILITISWAIFFYVLSNFFILRNFWMPWTFLNLVSLRIGVAFIWFAKKYSYLYSH